MTDQNIIEIIIKLAEEVENIIDLKGADKKSYVLNSLKTIIGEKAYNDHYFLIGGVIEFMVSVSKGRKININRKKIFCCI